MEMIEVKHEKKSIERELNDIKVEFNKLLTCEECNKICKTKDDFKTHILFSHQKEDIYCKVDQEKIENHQTIEKKINCEDCGPIVSL